MESTSLPGIECRSPASEEQSLSHWTTREVPQKSFLNNIVSIEQHMIANLKNIFGQLYAYWHISFFKNFNWRIIALQYCVGFCHTSTWISHRYTYVPSLLNLHPISHPKDSPFKNDNSPVFKNHIHKFIQISPGPSSRNFSSPLKETSCPLAEILNSTFPLISGSH